MPVRRMAWLGALSLCLSAWTARADEWRQYNGPASDRTSREAIGPIEWPPGGPVPHWRTPTTNGFSSFSIAGGKIFTLVSRNNQSGEREVCVAYDAATGAESWAAWLGEAWYDSGGGDGDGPRSTPSCDGERVFVYDANLCLYCFDADNGEQIWKQDIKASYAGRNISWRNAASPLLEGELVVVPGGGAGQSLLAFDRSDGHNVWKRHDQRMTHATPVAATLQGVRQIIFLAQSGLVAVSPVDGAELWRQPFPYNTATAASPVVSGNYVYCSAGYNVGAMLCRIDRNGSQLTPQQVWRKSNQLMNQWSTPVCYDGHLYGLYGHNSTSTAPLKCVELLTGAEKWSQPGFGQGNVILAGNHLVVLAENGRVFIVEATPTGYREIAQARMLTDKCWSTPILSDNRVYARSISEGVSFDLSKQDQAGVKGSPDMYR